jgi:hypothetical protein
MEEDAADAAVLLSQTSPLDHHLVGAATRVVRRDLELLAPLRHHALAEDVDVDPGQGRGD